MKAVIFIFCLVFLIVSCGDSSTDPEVENPEEVESRDCVSLDDKSLDIITGIRFFDETGNPIGQVGNPNVTDESPIRIYPNPNNGLIAISKQNDIEYDLFIISCEKDTLCSDIDFNDYNKFDYSIEALYEADNTTIDIETQDIQIQFQTDFAAGYYKFVLYNEDEEVIVENLYYDASKSVSEIIDFLNEEF